MPDNTLLNVATTAGDTIRNVSKSGVKTHVCLVDVGGSGTEKLIGDPGVALPVSGTVAVSNFPAGLASETSLVGLRLDLGVIHTDLAALGPINETAPNTDTAAAGLNGRLQRLAIQLTALLARLPAALTGSANLAVGVAEALPSGGNLIGSVKASRSLGTVYIGNTLVNVDRKAIDVTATGSGVTQLVAAVAGKRVYVLGFAFMSDAQVTARLVSLASGVASGDLTGPLPLSARGGVGGVNNDLGLFVSDADEGLGLSLSGAAVVGGWLVYIQV